MKNWRFIFKSNWAEQSIDDWSFDLFSVWHNCCITAFTIFNFTFWWERMSKYLEFRQVPFKGKTKRFHVISKSSNDIIGKISWYAKWRQYTFTPTYNTIWNKDCLNDIRDFINRLMEERKFDK